MDFQLLNDIFSADFNLDSIICVRQNRSPGSCVNYLDTPRRGAGLLLLDQHVVFEFHEGKPLQGRPGDVMLLPKNAYYKVTFPLSAGKSFHPIMVNFRLTDLAGTELPLGRKVLRLTKDGGTLAPLFTDAAQLYKNAQTARLKAKVYELVGNIFPIRDTDECCIGYINRHYTHNFSVPDLAKRCALSQSAYRKRFRQLTGASPVEYINRLKVEKACQLLCSSDLSVGDICEYLNFYSLPYFYKVFKDHTGLTPKQYRAQNI